MKIWKKSFKGSIKRSLSRKVNIVRGICEVLRLIYDETYRLTDVEVKKKITYLLIEALEMAKKMDDRLGYYKRTYNDTTGHSGKNLKPMDHNYTRWKLRTTR